MSAEFSSVSTSSFDPAALAAKLTEQAADGWTVVSILPTGGDITAFLTREGGSSPESAEAVVAAPVEAVEPEAIEPEVADPVPAFTPEPAAAEPAGWAVAPEPAPMAPIAEATQAYNPAPAYTPAPAPAYTPAPAPAATPAVPAGWYADPAGRFELRYWDGGTWTEHVSRAGQQFTDAPVA
jgi:hypothetical protein